VKPHTIDTEMFFGVTSVHILHPLRTPAMAVDCSAPPRELVWVSRIATVLWPPRIYCTPGENELCVSLTDITRQSKNREWERSFLSKNRSYTTCFYFVFNQNYKAISIITLFRQRKLHDVNVTVFFRLHIPNHLGNLCYGIYLAL
jgi:hypothetical protein